MKLEQVRLSNVGMLTSSCEAKGNNSKSVISAVGSNKEISQNESKAISALRMSEVNNSINFKGNALKQVVHIAPECAKIYVSSGGVGTVLNDWVRKWEEYDKGIENIYVLPYYAGVISDPDPQGYTRVSALTNKEGKTVVKIGDTLCPVEKILEGKGTTYSVDYGAGKIVDKVPYVVYDATESMLARAGIDNKDKNKRILLIQTPEISKLEKQYAKPKYAYSGERTYIDYSTFAKATSDAMSELKGATNGAFDPRNVIVHDYHSSAFLKYAHDKAMAGDPVFQKLNLGYVFHNAGRAGYQGVGADPWAMFRVLATPEQIKKVQGSIEFDRLIKDSKNCSPNADKNMLDFWKKLMPGLVDGNDEINPSMLPVRLSEAGYNGIVTVSGEYAREAAQNYEISSGLQESLSRLYNFENPEEGKFFGILNGLARPNKQSLVGLAYEGSSVYFNQEDENKVPIVPRYKDGTKIATTVAFDPEPFYKEGAAELTVEDLQRPLEEMNIAKAKSKAALVERLVRRNDIDETTMPTVMDGKQPKKAADGSIVKLSPNEMVTGSIGNKAIIITGMDEETLTQFKKNPDSKLFISWGRGDKQKAFDEVLTGIKKFIDSDRDDKKSLFVICGGLEKDKQDKEAMKIQAIIDDLMKDKKYARRFAFIDGRGDVGLLTSAADFALLPSREAPCELTPLEAQSRGCLTIVSNTGGLSQTTKDFDEVGAQFATGLKTKSGYHTIATRTVVSGDVKRDILDLSLIDQNKKTGKKVLEEAKKIIKNATEAKKKSSGSSILPEFTDIEISDILLKNEDFMETTLRAYRDDVMSDEIAEKISKAITIDRTTMTQMRKNVLTQEYDWTNNGIFNNGKSAFGMYSKFFFHDYQDVCAPVASLPTGKEIINNDFIETLAPLRLEKTPLNQIVQKKGNWFKEMSGLGKLGVLAAGAITIASSVVAVHFAKKSKVDTLDNNTVVAEINKARKISFESKEEQNQQQLIDPANIELKTQNSNLALMKTNMPKSFSTFA